MSAKYKVPGEKYQKNKIRMKRRIFTGLLTAVMLMTGFVELKADNDELPDMVMIELNGDEEAEEGDEESLWIEYPDYNEWERVSLEGKLKMKGLPVTPTLKVYMEKDSLIDISVRAPFVGEALRIELTADSIIAVNKMNKTYVKESVGGIRKYYPDGISDLQDLLLGRFFLPGFNIERGNFEELSELVDIIPADKGQFNVLPKGAAEIEGMKYGYIVNNYFQPLLILVMSGNVEIETLYKYKRSGYDLEFVMNDGERVMSATLELKEPDWGVEQNKRMSIDKKYRLLDLHEFVNRIGR